MKVIKRDGSEQEFDSNKIKKAIRGAWGDMLTKGENIRDNVLDDLTRKVVNKLSNKRAYTVEEIQDLVEFTLMEEKYYAVAKQYISYRQTHKIARNKYKDLMDLVNDKMQAKKVENQNANLDENTFSGKEKEAISVILREHALNNLVSETTRYNHLNNIIYIHDLDSYSSGQHNCLSIPFDDLLANGFTVKQTDIRPAGSVNSAMQLVAVICQLQSLCQFGGVSATHLDWTMVPYVRKSFAKHYRDGLKYIEKCPEIDYEIEFMLKNAKDYSIDDAKYEVYAPNGYKYALDMLERETHQAIEALFHNLNSLQSRSGCQLPFTSINYGTCALPEGRLIIKELLNVSIEGLGKFHRTSVFPCSIFQYMKGVNDKPGTPNYDLKLLALQSTAKRLYPNYANVDWSGNAGYDKNDPKTYFSTMG